MANDFLENSGKIFFPNFKRGIIFNTLTNLAGSNHEILIIGENIDTICKDLISKKNNVTGIETKNEIETIEHLEGYKKIKIEDINDSLSSLFIKNYQFDIIICFEVLEKIKEISKFLKLLKEHLNPNGFLIVSIPNFCREDNIYNIIMDNFPVDVRNYKKNKIYHYFGYKNICMLFFECEYEIRNLNKILINIDENNYNNTIKPAFLGLGQFIRSSPNSKVEYFIFTAHSMKNRVYPIFDNYEFKKISIQIQEESNIELRFALSHLLEKYQNLEGTLHNTEEALHNTEEALHNTEEALHNTEEALHNTEEALHNTEEALHNTEEALRNSYFGIRILRNIKKNIGLLPINKSKRLQLSHLLNNAEDLFYHKGIFHLMKESCSFIIRQFSCIKNR